MRPPASPSCRLYEPEAIGAYASAPAGSRKTGKKEHLNFYSAIHIATSQFLSFISYIGLNNSRGSLHFFGCAPGDYLALVKNNHAIGQP